MNSDEGYLLNEESRVTEEFTCRSCGEHISGYAAIDPVEIDEYFFCEHCANDYVSLRIDGYLDKVSLKTKKLVKEVDDANYHKAWQQEFNSDGSVKHI